jgi:hypothetical protein
MRNSLSISFRYIATLTLGVAFLSGIFPVSAQLITKRAKTLENEGGSLSTIEPETGCVSAKIDTTGSSGTSGTFGNIRTYSGGSFSVKASAWSRRKSDGLWQDAFLGAFSTGLGVTDRGEGNGDADRHRVDNVGDRQNYVLFEFNQPVVFDQAYLNSVLNDSDITVWIGNANNPYSNHLTLSDALLASFGGSETNDTSSSSARWANVNAANKVGNVVVIAASVSDDTPEDWFKIDTLDINCKPSSTARVEIIKQVGTIDQTNASTASFGFTATNLGTSAFSLVDNNIVGPDRFINNGITSFGAANAITVTEDQPLGWSLTDLSCTTSGGSTYTLDFANRKVTITPQAGGSTVCTFSNGQVGASAAKVSVSGRAMLANSRGISGAQLTLWDVQTGETRTVTTNTFGYYEFTEVELGKFYVVSISHPRYVFSQNMQSFSLEDSLTSLDFVY